MSPAEGPVSGGHGAGEVEARVQLAEPARTGHPGGGVTEGSRGAVTQLAIPVRPPAEGFVRPRHAAGVARARRHLAELASPDDRRRHQAPGVGSIAELALTVVTPAVALVVRITHAAGDGVAGIYPAEQ